MALGGNPIPVKAMPILQDRFARPVRTLHNGAHDVFRAAKDVASTLASANATKGSI